MSRIAIATDSVACLPPELVTRYDIAVVPLHVIMDGKTYRDGVDIMPDQIYQAMRNGARIPGTSAPSPGEVAQTFERLSQRTEAILCVTLASTLSAMFDAAQQAVDIVRARVPGMEITVLDSGTAGGAQGFIAVAAARAVASGARNLAEVTARAQQMREKVRLIATLDTLHYLAKGGRIGKAASWAGALLNVKPILDIRNGQVLPVDRPRTMTRALSRLLEMMQDDAGGKPVHANVHHASVREGAEAFREEIRARLNCVEAYLTDFTPVMGVHTGPGTIGVSYYADAD
ncbi:MAG: DegV family protein [Chloroflexi bacterium]|nr:DegV family protein [Chloroflexota bacterium]